MYVMENLIKVIYLHGDDCVLSGRLNAKQYKSVTYLRFPSSGILSQNGPFILQYFNLFHLINLIDFCVYKLLLNLTQTHKHVG